MNEAPQPRQMILAYPVRAYLLYFEPLLNLAGFPRHSIPAYSDSQLEPTQLTIRSAFNSPLGPEQPKGFRQRPLSPDIPSACSFQTPFSLPVSM
jgi:hypothetical protein